MIEIILTINRNELYQKTRGKASKLSKQRAGSVDITPIHPLLLSHVPQEGLVLEQVREDIHEYRPKSTIWELERGKNGSEVRMKGMIEDQMMMKKRKAHQWSIERKREETKKQGV